MVNNKIERKKFLKGTLSSIGLAGLLPFQSFRNTNTKLDQSEELGSLGKSIRDFGVLPGNTPEVNAQNLQKAIEWAEPRGAGLWVEPTKVPYPISEGIILKKNVSLIGVQGPTPRGTRNPDKKAPVGSVFKIVGRDKPFITVQSATQIRGIQFWYAEQELENPNKVIEYHPTIQVSKTTSTEGVTLSNLTFYGEYMAMDFNAGADHSCELILIEECYGYPLSGKFIDINYCYDIPRVLHCHINPAIMRKIGWHFSKEIVDSVVERKTFAYTINHTDNAQVMDIFTFATWGGIHLGDQSYGQMTNFNFDCVAVGIFKEGANTKNRNWQIAQGSIIANTGKHLEDIHPIIITGQGHTALASVEAFSGGNGALTTLNKSNDYLLIEGNEKLTVSIVGCRMRNYISDEPITVKNSEAVIQAVACIDKNEMFYNKTLG